MNEYIFIISEKGERTNICAGFELISLQKLIKYIQEDLKTIQQNKGKEWRERKFTHCLGTSRYSIRVGKVDDKKFMTRLLKYITLEEFENIFKDHIEDITPLLEYENGYDTYFKKEILKKYGKKI